MFVNLFQNNLLIFPFESMTSDDLEASVGVRLFTAGSAACIADLITFPLDTSKVRLQLQGEAMASAGETASKYRGLFDTIRTITRQEGPRALYNGLSAGLQRQMCFASVRLGLYENVKSIYQGWLSQSPDSLNVMTRILAGLTTGAMGVAFAQPTDVVKVRFQAQNKLFGMRYTSTIQAYREIGQQEGVRGLWKGALPNIIRNSIVNVSEIVCYDLVKQMLIHDIGMKDNIVCHFSSAVAAGKSF